MTVFTQLGLTFQPSTTVLTGQNDTAKQFFYFINTAKLLPTRRRGDVLGHALRFLVSVTKMEMTLNVLEKIVSCPEPEQKHEVRRHPQLPTPSAFLFASYPPTCVFALKVIRRIVHLEHKSCTNVMMQPPPCIAINHIVSFKTADKSFYSTELKGED